MFNRIDSINIINRIVSNSLRNSSIIGLLRDGRSRYIIFSNEDVYLGNLKGMSPHVNGKYTSDRIVYEGGRDKGRLTGKRKVSYILKNYYLLISAWLSTTTIP